MKLPPARRIKLALEALARMRDDVLRGTSMREDLASIDAIEKILNG